MVKLVIMSFANFVKKKEEALIHFKMIKRVEMETALSLIIQRGNNRQTNMRYNLRISILQM